MINPNLTLGVYGFVINNILLTNKNTLPLVLEIVNVISAFTEAFITTD